LADRWCIPSIADIPEVASRVPAPPGLEARFTKSKASGRVKPRSGSTAGPVPRGLALGPRIAIVWLRFEVDPARKEVPR